MKEQNCTTYRGINLISHTLKLWQRIIEQKLRYKITEQKLRHQTNVSEKPIWFTPEKSTLEVIYILRRLREMFREKKRDLHMVLY